MGKHLGTDKDIEKFARQLRKKGWRVEVTSGNHLRWSPPGGGKPVISPLTGTRFALTRLRAEIRRAGHRI